MKSFRTMMAMLFLATCAAAAPAAPQSAPVKIEGGYAVVVSKATRAKPGWATVVDALVKKYAAQVIEYDKSVDEAREPLAKLFPRYACFVAQPEEASRTFVVSVHRLTRKLDDDPYTDALWAVLTGYTADDALRIATCSEPLVVRKGAGGTGIPLEAFGEGKWYSEGEKGAMWEKTSDGKVEKKKCPDDSTQALVDVFNIYKPDLFMTSGHATERDWQIGYSYRNGQFRCLDGALLGIDLKRQKFPIDSPNPKVYLPLGNCLMGRIADKQSMALAFMHTGGVNQMCGYVVSTWYGYAGWGIRDYFLGQPGRFSLAEAFYANNQALVERLESRFAKSARTELDNWEIERDPALIGRIAASLGHAKWSDEVKDNVGLLWDRDTLALYGDPAWDARLAPRDLAWEQSLVEKDGRYTFTLAPKRNASLGRPPFQWLPHRVRDVEFVQGKEFEPVVTDNFVLLPKPGKLEKDKPVEIVFTAKRAM